MKRARSAECVLIQDVDTEFDSDGDVSDTNPGIVAEASAHVEAAGAGAEAFGSSNSAALYP